jgi:polyferredoxin
MKKGCNDQEIRPKRTIELPVLAGVPAVRAEVSNSRAAKWRAAALITLTLLMIGHVIQWRLSGSTVSPIEPSEAMATLQRGAINAGCIFFSLAILGTLIFGRFVCGWGCHIVALQDLCAGMVKKIGLTPRPFRSRLLMFVPLIAALYMFVWPTVARWVYKPKNEPLIPQFTNHLVTTDFWGTFPTVAVAIPFLFICGFVTVYFLGQKGFCTYACPYGGFFNLADKVSPGKIRVTDACNQCGHCTAVCTSNVLVHAEVKQYGMVVDSGCMKCMDCISVCPTDALYFGFGKPSVLAGSGSDSERVSPASGGAAAAAAARPTRYAKNYSLTWPEEIAAAVIFSASFLAVWDAYQLVPMLMALGIAPITAYLALRSWKLFRAKDLSFYRFNLKIAGKIRTAGWAFLAFAFVWIVMNAHTGFIHYHESAGSAAYENVKIADELALAQANPGPWLSAADRQNIAEGKSHLGTAINDGLFVNSDAIPKLAWLEYLSGDAARAVELLDRAAAHQSGQGKALSLYYRGAILNRTKRYEDALASLDRALAEAPDLTLAREERGESLWMLGRRDEAVASWREAVERNASLPVANNQLSGAAAANGDQASATAYQQQADRSTPNDPLFHWMVGLRMQNIGMNDIAERHFQNAIDLNPEFRRARAINAQQRQ